MTRLGTLPVVDLGGLQLQPAGSSRMSRLPAIRGSTSKVRRVMGVSPFTYVNPSWPLYSVGPMKGEKKSALYAAPVRINPRAM